MIIVVKKHLMIGFIVLIAILSLPAIHILSNDNGLTTSTPNLIVKGPRLDCIEKQFTQHGSCGGSQTQGNSWGG